MPRTVKAPLAAALALALAACSGGAPEEPADRPTPETLVASGAASGYSVRLLAAAPLQVGLNALALDVELAGSTVTDASVELSPLHTTTVTDPSLAFIPHVATSTSATHRCPVVGPSAAGADGRYALQVVFQVPSGPGAWTAEVSVTRDGTTVSVPLSTLAVAEGKNLAASFLDGGTGYVLALEFLSAPRVGVVPVGVTLHEAQGSGMTFAPVSDATLGLVPEMPSMGHGGGAGGVDPVLVTTGWYEGKVSFTMPGPWLITVPASRPGGPIGAPELRVFF